MVTIARFCKVGFHRFLREYAVAATFSLLLLTALSALAQTAAKKPVEPAAKKEPEIKEELTLKNGDRLTGELLNSTGTEIKFKTELAGEVTVKWENVKELKSKRDFAVVPKDLKDARESAKVPQGAIKIGEKGIVVSPVSTTKPETGRTVRVRGETGGDQGNRRRKRDTDLQNRICGRRCFVSEGDKQEDRFQVRLGWAHHHRYFDDLLDPKQLPLPGGHSTQAVHSHGELAGAEAAHDDRLHANVREKTTQPGTETTITNIFHVGGERDEYFSPRGYYLQVLSEDHNYSQGLVLQQKYGGGIGATLFKKKDVSLISQPICTTKIKNSRQTQAPTWKRYRSI